MRNALHEFNQIDFTTDENLKHLTIWGTKDGEDVEWFSRDTFCEKIKMKKKKNL